MKSILFFFIGLALTTATSWANVEITTRRSAAGFTAHAAMTVGDGVVTTFKLVSYCAAKATTFNLYHLNSISQTTFHPSLPRHGLSQL